MDFASIRMITDDLEPVAAGQIAGSKLGSLLSAGRRPCSVWPTCGCITADAVSWRPWLRRQTDKAGGEMAGDGGGR
jgi:hypothetical protein